MDRRRAAYLAAALGSVVLIAVSTTGRAPFGIVETLGFVSGAWCVWLTVLANIWNWPVGVANSALYLVVFLRVRLFADSSLQVVYIVLGFLGWYWWLHGGKLHARLSVRRTGLLEAAVVGVAVAAATVGMTAYLRSIHDSAPLLDAFTTCLSLGAQYLLTRKLFENWYLWITVDAVYIGLYAWRGLYLTSALYVIYGTMCVIGLREWRRTLRAGVGVADITGMDPSALITTNKPLPDAEVV
jgi:nicotinamide mononucleotide transporter